jgi:integrase
MPRQINKLSSRKVETAFEPGRYSDGGNLYLSISSNGGKRWVFFYRFKGKQREMGLGSAAKGGVPLAKARELAGAARLLLSSGLDPLAAKRITRQAQREIPTFGEFADTYIASHRSKWRSDKHAAQWAMTLTAYCAPIRSKPVNAIDTEAVLKVLQPIWGKLPETASRLRGRIENVLDAAKAKGYLAGENPARWRGHLKSLLPTRQKLSRGHHAAIPFDDLPAFIAALRARKSTAALALELAILTACRSGEVLNARWHEFDLEKGVWTIPAQRMKAGVEHRVPLSGRVLAILRPLKQTQQGEYVFPGTRPGKPLSSMSMAMQLRRMKRDDITVHGFRSTFRDWASEKTTFSHETCEHALAHGISDKAEAAYRRGDQFDKRRKLMEAWATYCENRGSSRSKIIAFAR